MQIIIHWPNIEQLLGGNRNKVVMKVENSFKELYIKKYNNLTFFLIKTDNNFTKIPHIESNIHNMPFPVWEYTEIISLMHIICGPK